jgi:23S rRNA pseudouridine1911/1915/1917 synthase
LERQYLAFVWGAPDRPKGTIEAPLGRHPHARDKQAIRQDGRGAITHWELLEKYDGNDGKPVASLLACRLETGRTHQIRVHLAHIGHPLLGDDTYGPGFRTKAVLLAEDARQALDALARQALHAHILGFQHPESRRVVRYKSPLPDDLANLRQSLTRGAAPRRQPGSRGNKN